MPQAFRTNDKVRLQVALDPTATTNLFRNGDPSLGLGTYGWETPGAGFSITTSGTRFRLTGDPNTANSSGRHVAQTHRIAVTAGQWVGVGLDFLARGASIDGIYFNYAFNDANDNLVANLTTNGYITTLGRIYDQVQAPTNAASVLIRIYGTSTASTWTSWVEFNKLALRVGATQAAVSTLAYTEPTDWLNVLGKSHNITFSHQGLGLGTLAATVFDSTLDPAVSTALRAGRAIRVTAQDPTTSTTWNTVWTGTILTARSDYDLSQQVVDRRAKIQISAGNGIAQASNRKSTLGVDSIAQLRHLLEYAGTLPWQVNGSPDQVTGSVTYGSTKMPDYTILDQVAVTRDSRSGYAWVDRRGTLQVYDSASMPTTLAATLTETDYTALAVDYDTDRTINEVTVHALRNTLATGQTGEVVFGPYRDQASIDKWGAHSTDVTVQGLTDAEIAAYGAAVLAANANPVRKVNSLRYAIKTTADLATDAGSKRAMLDTYDMVRVINTAGGIDQQLRPTTITHTLTANPTSDKWLVDVEFATPGAAATPIQVPSPPGPTTVAGSISGWIPLTYANGWKDYGGGWEPGAYRVVDGVCYLRGLLLGGTYSGGTTITTLPAGARYGSASHVLVGSNGATGILNIYASGAININTINQGWLSLANVSFPVDG